MSRRATKALRLQQLGAIGGALVLASLLSGCASEADRQREAEPAPTTFWERVVSTSYLCGSHAFPASAVDEPTRIADLGDAERAAITGATNDIGEPVEIGDPESWIVVSREEDEISLIRPRNEPVAEANLPGPRSPAPDYEELSIFTAVKPSEWKIRSSGGCRLTYDLGEFSAPELMIDLGSSPDGNARELRLLVTDPACGGDTDMPGRIENVRVDETETEVKVLVEVRPLSAGAYDCKGFAPTPYTVTLEKPLGDRVVIDASRVNRFEVTAVEA